MHAATTPNDKPITAQHKNKHALAFITKKIILHTKELILSCNIDDVAVGMDECTDRL